MTHAIIAAAREFSRDESRRRNRHQKPRLKMVEHIQLNEGLRAIDSPTTPEGVKDAYLRAVRGSVTVAIFGYADTVDENAATVITDILHAVAAAGYSPQAGVNQAAAYFPGGA